MNQIVRNVEWERQPASVANNQISFIKPLYYSLTYDADVSNVGFQQRPATDARTNSMASVTPDEINAKIEASEARSETKVARLEGKLDTLSIQLSAKLDALSSDISSSRSEANENRRWITGTVVGSAFGIAALLIGVMTYGDAIFSRGMSVRDVVRATVEEVSKTPPVKP